MEASDAREDLRRMDLKTSSLRQIIHEGFSQCRKFAQKKLQNVESAPKQRPWRL
jgi:hypothetical protein